MKRPRTHLLIICLFTRQIGSFFWHLQYLWVPAGLTLLFIFSVHTSTPFMPHFVERSVLFLARTWINKLYTRGRSHAFVLFCLSAFGGREKRDGRSRGGWGYLGWEHLVWHYINKEWQPGKTGEQRREACQSRVDQQGRCAENKDSIAVKVEFN